jgi:hypothetical protein
MGAKVKTAPAKMKAIPRRTEIAKARAEGKTYAQLAAQFQLSVRRIREILNEEFVRLTTERTEAAVDALKITLTRLDDLLQAVWDEAMQGDPEAVKTALAVIDRQMKVLGLGVIPEAKPQGASVNVFVNLEERARQLGLSLDVLRGPEPPLTVRALPHRDVIEVETKPDVTS